MMLFAGMKINGKTDAIIHMSESEDINSTKNNNFYKWRFDTFWFNKKY